jgi:hypothetical protein
MGVLGHITIRMVDALDARTTDSRRSARSCATGAHEAEEGQGGLDRSKECRRISF